MAAFPVVREFFKTASSPLALDYFSQTPYALGEHVVKYFAKSIETHPTLPGDGNSNNLLSDAMRQVLSKDRRSAKFEFGVEVQLDPGSMPIDDGTAVWNSPEKVILATITIPPQDFPPEDSEKLEQALSFTPWRTLREHQPLGSLNLARRDTYVDSSTTRHEQTQIPREEPSLEEFNRRTLVRFYDCFRNGDYRGMQGCLHPEVEFDDVGFDVRGKEVAAMWHMIVSKGIAVTYENVHFENGHWRVDWQCDYEFRVKPDSHPNPVHNKVHATFEFEGGLIRKHSDDCDFWVWFEQAMGLKGRAIHLFDCLEGMLEKVLRRDVPIDVDRKVRAEVKKTAKENIAAFVQQHPEYRS
ncbi:MAG: nuclear transport factor 2 family protein [Planctomycetota bacterium]|nr:nuclear transport factor 2 family protein [Planctomycetota bacterium]